MEWHDRRQKLPRMYVDEDGDFELSDPVLGVTKDGLFAVVRCTTAPRGGYCFVMQDGGNGEMLPITHWTELPPAPEVRP